MVRKNEWIAAEESLELACMEAITRGYFIVHGKYGIDISPEGLYETTNGAICPIGAYMLGRHPAVKISKTAASCLGVDDLWTIGVELGFDDAPIVPKEDERKIRMTRPNIDLTPEGFRQVAPDLVDGVYTGIQLRQRFNPRKG